MIPSPRSLAVEFPRILPYFLPQHLPPTVRYHPFSCFGFTGSQFGISSALGLLECPCPTEEPVLLGVQSFATSESQIHIQPLHLGKRCRAWETAPSGRAEQASCFRQPPGSLRCDLWPAAVCDLWPASRPPRGQGTQIPTGLWKPPPPAALPASVLGAGTQGSQLETLLCCSAMAEGGGPSDGEADTPPTCLREQPASGCRNGFFRTPAICSDAQGKKSFHDSLKSYSVLPPLPPGLLSATRGVTLPQEVLSPVNLVPNNSQIGRVTVLGPPPVRS